MQSKRFVSLRSSMMACYMDAELMIAEYEHLTPGAQSFDDQELGRRALIKNLRTIKNTLQAAVNALEELYTNALPESRRSQVEMGLVADELSQ